MNEGLIPARYAKALFKFAEESGDTNSVYMQMKRLCDSFSNLKKLQTIVDNPYMPISDKEAVLLTAAGAAKDSIVDKFILMIIKNNRVNYIRNMAYAYQEIYRKTNAIARVEITTAGDIDSIELDKIKKVVAMHEEGKTIEFSHNVDPELIGGFVVKIDSTQLDASIKNELKKLRLKLLS